MSIFSDSMNDFFLTYWPYLLIATFLFAAFLLLIISYSIFNRKHRKFDSDLFSYSNSLRVYLVNMEDETVYFYSNKNLKDRRSISLEAFLNQYRSKDRNKLKHWLTSLSQGDENASYSFEADFVSRSYHTTYHTVLTCYSIDPGKGKLYLESHLFKALSFNAESRIKRTTSVEDFEEILKNVSPKIGVCFCFRFSYKSQSMEGEEFDSLTLNQIKDVIYRRIPKNKCYMIEVGSAEIALFNLKTKDEKNGSKFAFSILEDVSRFLSLNSLVSLIDVRVGAVEHHYFPNAGKSILSEAEKCAELAYERASSSYWYNESKSQEENSTGGVDYQKEIEKIIEKRKLSFYFRPIFSIEKKRVIGYLSKAVPENPHFSSMEELKQIAEKNGETRVLLSSIIKNVVPTFIAQKEHSSDHLYLPISISELPFLFLALSKITTTTTLPIYFVFKDTDIKEYMINTTIEDFIDAIGPIKKAGYKIVLQLSESSLILPEGYYPLFDAFIVSFSSQSPSSSLDAKIRAELHALVEKTLKYGKPIIASDIQGWNSIELLIRSGLEFISSDTISSYQTMILPLNDKTSKRLLEMKGN